ncbi:ribosome silencing factor [Methylotenera sp. G11]|uniref:ribosome silencing factor n=1 Tax=Methylotenera sp. G11 TaxID=1506585 RepID=UPI000648F24B|nr:ribosome silencing factor [Methylotenera sp. G11]
MTQTTQTIAPHNEHLEAMKLAVIDAIEDIKGFDITVMDVRKLTSMTNYMIVASANSSRQAKAVADNVREKLKEKGFAIRGTEGEKEGEWVLVDLDDIVVHIMVPATRAYYNLEQLWGEAESRRSHIKAEE